MIAFTPMRTRRLAIRLKELSIGDAVKLCSLAPDRHEAATTEFLTMALAEATRPSARHLTDPRAWTVQERIWCIVSYIIATGGVVDFAVGSKAQLSDYFLGGIDFPEKPLINLGSAAGAEWTMKPLTGAEAEAIESTRYLRNPAMPRLHWVAGAMAAQLRKGAEVVPDPLIAPVDYQSWLIKRIDEIEALGESEFTELLRQFWLGQDQLSHFFKIGFDDFGVVALPAKEADEDARPARFPVDSCLSAIAKSFAGKAQDAGG